MTSPDPNAPPSENKDTSETSSQCLANARLVLEDREMQGAVHIEGDKIVGLTEGDDVPPGALDCGGDYLVPGLVELHTDNLERHMEPRPAVKVPHDTAILAHDAELASVGIVTVFDALRLGSIRAAQSDMSNRYGRKVASEILSLRDAGGLRVRHLIHLRAEICSESLIDELAEFGADDRVGLVSLMDHTPGQRQFRDLAKLKTYYTGKYAMSEAEFEDLVSRRVVLGDKLRDPHEAAAVAAAKAFGATLASHDDTTREQVESSHDKGIRLAEFPTTLEAAEACRAAGMQIIMGAPNLVRGGSHSGNVSALELAENDLLDIVSSDYVPSLLIASAFRLGALWSDLPKAIRTVTANPADATGLGDRGRIEVGKLADLARVRVIGQVPVVTSVWRGGDRVG